MENFERAKALFYDGLALLEREEYAPAANILQEALQLVPDRLSTINNLTLALIKLGRLAEAEELGVKACALDERSPETWLNLGLIRLKQADNNAAIDYFERATAIDPEFAEAWLNKGIACHQINRHVDALESFEEAIRFKPGDADIHYNRGLAMQALEQTEDALSSFRRAIELRPAFPAAQYQIFSHHLAALADGALIEKLGEEISLQTLQREIAALHEKKVMSDFRVLHELEQSAHLLALGHDGDGLQEANAILRDVYAGYLANEGHTAGTKQIHLDDRAVAGITRYLAAGSRYRVPVFAEDCLAAHDWPAIEERYFSSSPEMIYIDNLLSPRALAELRKFCLISAVWKKDYRNQYLGAFPDDGFISPLHVRIASELRQKMPRIFGLHRLEQVWGFKYTSRMGGGINVHADFARVNLNFWITPDDANLDPESGGLIVYDAPCPPSWGFKDYNQDEQAIYDFLKRRGANSIRVPYKCNRAVLFNSNLFHETDKINFREGYENRRINITCLFGKGLKTD